MKYESVCNSNFFLNNISLLDNAPSWVLYPKEIAKSHHPDASLCMLTLIVKLILTRINLLCIHTRIKIFDAQMQIQKIS